MRILRKEEKLLISKMRQFANEVCKLNNACYSCPINISTEMRTETRCVKGILADVDDEWVWNDEPNYEELPIDLDNCVCDSCDKPGRWGCYNMDECKEDYPFGECCADNLEDNVGRICFENNLPSKLAKDLIELIKKERERNESLYVHREYFKDK